MQVRRAESCCEWITPRSTRPESSCFEASGISTGARANRTSGSSIVRKTFSDRAELRGCTAAPRSKAARLTVNISTKTFLPTGGRRSGVAAAAVWLDFDIRAERRRAAPARSDSGTPRETIADHQLSLRQKPFPASHQQHVRPDVSPGGFWPVTVRDCMVVGYVLLREWSSIPGLGYLIRHFPRLWKKRR